MRFADRDPMRSRVGPHAPTHWRRLPLMWFYQRLLLATQSKSRSLIKPSRPPPKDKRIDELATQRQLKTFRSLDWDWVRSVGLRLAVCSPRNISASGVVPPLIT